jgi:hypothetical protein
MGGHGYPVPGADNLKMKQINLKRIIFEYENCKSVVLEGRELQEWLLQASRMQHELFLLQNRNV